MKDSSLEEHEPYSEIQNSHEKHNLPEGKFYETYKKIYNETINKVQYLEHKEFRDIVIEEHGETIETIKLFAPSLQNTLKKPQRLLYDDDDYYIGIDIRTNTYYVCYKHLLMIDIDYYKDRNNNEIDIKFTREQIHDQIIEKFQLYANKYNLRFRLYASRNGIHAFLINKICNYKDDKDIQIMLDLDCDFYYSIYSYLRGWCVRLNRKTTEATMSYKYISDIGIALPIDKLEKLTNLHINLVDVFKHVEPSMMFGK